MDEFLEEEKINKQKEYEDWNLNKDEDRPTRTLQQMIEENEMEAKLNDSKNIYQNAKSYYKRIDMLHREGGISDSDYEKAYTNMKSAEFGIKIAKERLALAKEKSSYGFFNRRYRKTQTNFFFKTQYNESLIYS